MATILVVDDSPSIRQMVCFTLKQAGFAVQEAADGVEALDLAQKQKYDLVLADVNMPRLDGIQLTRALRQMPTYRFVPILLLTTESAPEKKQAGRAAGATGWLVKPFQPDKLVATIRRVCGS